MGGAGGGDFLSLDNGFRVASTSFSGDFDAFGCMERFGLLLWFVVTSALAVLGSDFCGPSLFVRTRGIGLVAVFDGVVVDDVDSCNSSLDLGNKSKFADRRFVTVSNSRLKSFFRDRLSSALPYPRRSCSIICCVDD